MEEGLPWYSFVKLEDGRVGWAMAGWDLGGTDTTREWIYNRVIYELLQLHTSTCRGKHMQNEAYQCVSECTSVWARDKRDVHELHPSAGVKGLFAGNISSQQGAAASCSTLSSLTTAKYCSYRAPRAQLSLTVIFNPSIPKIINLTALLTILHTSNISTSLIALSRPISFLLQPRSNSFLHLHMGLPAFYATKSSTTVFGFVCVWASTLRGINSLVPDRSITGRRSISQDYQDSSERGGLLIIPLIPLLSIPLLFRCSKRFHISNITSQIFKGTVSSKTILKGIILLKITLKWTVDPKMWIRSSFTHPYVVPKPSNPT